MYIHTCIYRKKPAFRNKASTKAKSSPVPSIPPGKDICSQFHLKVPTLRWLQPLQNLDGGHPPQQGQHSQTPASPSEPFSSKQRTSPRDASAPLPGCWRGGTGQQHSSPQAESSLVLQCAQRPVLGMGDHTLGKQSSLLIAQSKSTGMEKLTLKGKDWTES